MADPAFDQLLIIPAPKYENSYPPYSAGIVGNPPVLITKMTGKDNLLSISKDVSYLAYNQLRLSHELVKIDAKIANMQPLIITQSVSFLVGAFIAIAFVIAVSKRL